MNFIFLVVLKNFQIKLTLFVDKILFQIITTTIKLLKNGHNAGNN